VDHPSLNLHPKNLISTIGLARFENEKFKLKKLFIVLKKGNIF
jgi:hypothetical protein